MNIYTKTGDEGTTGSFGGQRFRKDDLIIELNGCIDECIAGVESLILKESIERNLKQLNRVYDALYILGAEISSGKTTNIPKVISQGFVDKLENLIDEFDINLTVFQRFTTEKGVLANELRVKVRKLERVLTKMLRVKALRPVTYAYINRLSDYVFALSISYERETSLE